MRSVTRSKAALGFLIAAMTEGCGFVAGVDFFDLERAEDAGASNDASATEDAIGAERDASAEVDATRADADASTCTTASDCRDFDDCQPLRGEDRTLTAGSDVTLDVTSARSWSAPCSLHAALGVSSTARTSAYRVSRAVSPTTTRADVGFWMFLESIDDTAPKNGAREGAAPVAEMSFGITPKSQFIRVRFIVGKTKALLLGSSGSSTLTIGEAPAGGLVGGWHHVAYAIERAPAKLRISVVVDDDLLLEGETEVSASFIPDQFEALVGLTDAVTKTTPSSVFVDDVRAVLSVPPP